jgi:hypothetical protein
MSEQWTYKVVEIAPGLLGTIAAEKLQEALNQQGSQGWDLVSVTHSPLHQAILYFKKRK